WSRTSRGKPTSFSRLFIMWVRPDWVTPSRSAARVKLPSSTAVTMASHFFVSISHLLHEGSSYCRFHCTPGGRKSKSSPEKNIISARSAHTRGNSEKINREVSLWKHCRPSTRRTGRPWTACWGWGGTMTSYPGTSTSDGGGDG